MPNYPAIIPCDGSQIGEEVTFDQIVELFWKTENVNFHTELRTPFILDATDTIDLDFYTGDVMINGFSFPTFPDSGAQNYDFESETKYNQNINARQRRKRIGTYDDGVSVFTVQYEISFEINVVPLFRLAISVERYDSGNEIYTLSVLIGDTLPNVPFFEDINMHYINTGPEGETVIENVSVTRIP